MAEPFICIERDYKTTKKCNYERHIKSKKHLIKINNSEVFRCSICNYESKKKSNFLRHMNIHTQKTKTIEENLDDNTSSKLKSSLNKILKEQENIKKMIPKSGGNTIINNKLSINVFLNTKCKQAMSIEDFVSKFLAYLSICAP